MSKHLYFSNHLKLRFITRIIIFSSLIFCLNIIPGIFTISNGYISFGDCIFLIICFFLSKEELLLIALLSYSASDLYFFSWYYAPISVLIRVMYVFIVKTINNNPNNSSLKKIFLSILISQLLMIAIYFLADILFWKVKFFLYASVYKDLIYNLIQGTVITIITTLVYIYLKSKRNNILKKIN